MVGTEFPWRSKAVKLSRIFSIFAAVCLFTGCNDDMQTAASVAESLRLVEEQEKVIVLTWEEYFSPDVVAEFEQETGIKVEFVYFENLEEMRSLLQSRPGGIDVLVCDGAGLADLIELQLLQRVQPNLITNFANLDSMYLNLMSDPGNEFSVPYMWGTTLIAYRSDLIQEPERSWASLMDQKYKGKVLILDDTFDSYAAALLSLGFDINSEDPDELGKALDLLLDHVNKNEARFEDIINIREKLLSGECWMGMTYSSDAAVLAEENEHISYFIPNEGAALWLDSFAIARESPNSVGAHRFIDFICRGDVAGRNSNDLWCASANKAAHAYLSAEILAEKTLYPDPETLRKCRFATKAGATRNRLVNQGMKLIYDRLAQNTMKSSDDALASESSEKEDEISADLPVAP